MSKSKILFGIISIIPMIIFILIYGSLDDTVAIHFNAQYEADGYGSKNIYFLLMSMSILMYIFSLVFKPKKNKKYTPTILNAVIVFFVFVELVIISAVKYENIEVFKVLNIFISLFFIFIGNITPKLSRNRYVGIRIPPTLKNDVVWDKTHRVGGKLFVLMGIELLIVSLFITNSLVVFIFIMMSNLILILIIITVYAYKIQKEESLK